VREDRVSRAARGLLSWEEAPLLRETGLPTREAGEVPPARPLLCKENRRFPGKLAFLPGKKARCRMQEGFFPVNQATKAA